MFTRQYRHWLPLDSDSMLHTFRPGLVKQIGHRDTPKVIIFSIKVQCGLTTNLAALIRDDVVLGEDQSLAAAGV